MVRTDLYVLGNVDMFKDVVVDNVFCFSPIRRKLELQIVKLQTLENNKIFSHDLKTKVSVLLIHSIVKYFTYEIVGTLIAISIST